MATTITFGTSGWRGLIARDFTFDNVRVATQGIALFLQSELKRPDSPVAGRPPVVIVGHDTRFLGREFSLAAAEVLTQAVHVLSDEELGPQRGYCGLHFQIEEVPLVALTLRSSLRVEAMRRDASDA